MLQNFFVFLSSSPFFFLASLVEFRDSLGYYLSLFVIFLKSGQPLMTVQSFLCNKSCEGEGSWIDASSRTSLLIGRVTGDSATGGDNVLMHAGK